MSFFSSRVGPTLWVAAAVVAAAAGGWLLGRDSVAAGIVLLVMAAGCGMSFMAVNGRIRRRVNFIVEAAGNNDFAYHFAENEGSSQERAINASLNKLVAHLQSLCDDARHREEYLSLIINLVDTGIVVADERGNVLQHNRAALALLGRPVLTHVCQIPTEDANISVSSTETTLNGHPVSIRTISDIRRPLQAKEVEVWERMTRVLTHEIMNSLTPVTSIASSLKESADTDTDLAAQLEVIVQSGQSLMDFVHKFRKLTLLPKPQPSIFALGPFLLQAAELARSYPGGPTIDIDVEVSPPDTLVYTDRSMLHQVVLNILKNGVEAISENPDAGSGQEGRISIRAKVLSDESIRITITNSGPVIPDSVAANIFTPFFTTRPGGSGIGLSFSRRLITHLGGTLTLTRLPRTTFTIVI